jgi:type I restriction enzyme S subunit
MKNGWQIKKIGDVCSLMTGGTPSKVKPEYFDGNIKWLVSGDIHQGEIFDCEGRITEAGMKNSNAKLLPANSVMIALNGQGKTKGTVAILRTRATCNQSLVSIYPNEPEKLLPEFLYANLHGRYQEIRQMTGDSGNDRRGLNMTLIGNIEIPIAPLPDQRRIVRILNGAFDNIAKAQASAEKNLQNARTLFESFHHSVFSRKHAGWVEKPLGEVCEYANGKAHEQCINKDGQFIVINSKFISSDGKVFKKSHDALLLLQPGDIAMVLSDVPNGKAFAKCFLVEQANTYTLNQRICLIRSTKFHTKFLFYQLNRNRHFLSFDNGENQTNLRLNQVLSCPLFLPPLAEQKTIADNLDAMSEETQRLASLYERKLAALAALKQSLLHQAFTGNL